MLYYPVWKIVREPLKDYPHLITRFHQAIKEGASNDMVLSLKFVLCIESDRPWSETSYGVRKTITFPVFPVLLNYDCTCS